MAELERKTYEYGLTGQKDTAVVVNGDERREKVKDNYCADCGVRGRIALLCGYCAGKSFKEAPKPSLFPLIVILILILVIFTLFIR